MSKVQLAELLSRLRLALETQEKLVKLTLPMHTKCRRDSDAPLTVSTTDFKCNFAAPDVDVWGSVNAP